MDSLAWFKNRVDQLAGLKESVREAYNLTDNRTYSKGIWSFKKLLILAFYIDIFTNTAESNFRNVVYVDLLAGPGLNYIKDIDLLIAGSPLLALEVPRILKSGKTKAFDKMIVVDNNEKNYASLNKSLTSEEIDIEILCEDCNSNTVLDEIREATSPWKSIFLCFVDPEGVEEVGWSTMEELFALHGDFVINYPYTGAARLCGSFHGSERVTKESIGSILDNFFGTREWRSFPCENGIGEDLYDLYITRLRQYRGIIVEFPIMGEVGGYQYRILVAAKETSGGSPWMKPVFDLRDKIESLTHSDVKKLISVYRGEQSILEDFG